MSTQLLIPEIRGDGTIARWVWLSGHRHHLLDCFAIATLGRTPASKLPPKDPNDGRESLLRAGLAFAAQNGACYLEHDGMEARRQLRALERRGLTARTWAS